MYQLSKNLLPTYASYALPTIATAASAIAKKNLFFIL